MNTNGLHGYIITLRKARGLTQDELAEATGVALRTWTNWERGDTGDIKASVLFKALDRLGGSVSDVAAVIDADYDTGIAVAQRRLGMICPVVTSGDELVIILHLIIALHSAGKLEQWIADGRALLGEI